jgi:hypothetical protein
MDKLRSLTKKESGLVVLIFCGSFLAFVLAGQAFLPDGGERPFWLGFYLGGAVFLAIVLVGAYNLLANLHNKKAVKR